MKNVKFIGSLGLASLLIAALVVAVGMPRSGVAYPTYTDIITADGNCFACHGDFRGATSTKGTVFPGDQNHEMHRNAGSMNTACNLCHTGSDRSVVYLKSSNGTANNAGLGCTGCHVPLGLIKHHRVNGVNCSTTCHPNTAAPQPETVKPPYYGTVDTRANNPGNTALVSNTNENWSVGDFLGLDNDGNNLYDLADYAVGPFRILSLAKEGNDLRVSFQTAGGRTNTVQSGTTLGSYADLSAPLGIPGIGIVTTNYLHVGGATNAGRYYRLRELVP